LIADMNYTQPAEAGGIIERKAKGATDALVIPALLTLSLIVKYFIPTHERTIHRWISAGEFPKADIRKGRKIRFWRRKTVETWIGENSEEK
jgi:hypothetical protein